MITEDYISFGTARLLKEKGFDETCRAFWKKWNGEINFCDCNTSHIFEYCHNTMLENYNDDEELNIAAPTLQMVMKWLREVYKIGIFPSTYTTIKGSNITHTYGTVIINLNTYELMTLDSMNRETYEDACEAAIGYCFKNLI